MLKIVRAFAQRLSLTERRRVIVVLGARSGTSALAGALRLLGCTLPRNIMAANHGNPTGYFEPQALADQHDALLERIGSSWDDPRPFPEAWFSSEEAKTTRGALANTYLQNFTGASPAVLKEPRMCRILPLWNQVFDDLALTPVFCLIDRHPMEVAGSLTGRDGSSCAQGLRYYIRNHLDAERDTRRQRRAFIAYADLLADWRSTIARMTRELSIPLRPTPGQTAEVDAFIDAGMRHQYHGSSPVQQGELGRIALEVHQAFSKLSSATRQSPARNELDRLRIQFDRLPS